MLVTIPSLLNAEELAQVNQILNSVDFEPGGRSAGTRAKPVKNNMELPMNAYEHGVLNGIVMNMLVQNETYRSSVLPLRVAAPFYARYTEGMGYGQHIDDPVMGEGARYRSDVSITIFLNSPEEYGGGELCIETPFGEQSVKLDAGSAVLYPSSSLHRVNIVTHGQRLVAVTWAQSMVRSAEQRDILYALAVARANLFTEQPESASTSLVDNAYVNLVRMWADV